MNALQCDRCGEFFVKSELEPLKTKFSVQQMDRVIIPKWNIDDREKYFEKFDLCEECTKVFIDFFQKFFQGRR